MDVCIGLFLFRRWRTDAMMDTLKEWSTWPSFPLLYSALLLPLILCRFRTTPFRHLVNGFFFCFSSNYYYHKQLLLLHRSFSLFPPTNSTLVTTLAVLILCLSLVFFHLIIERSSDGQFLCSQIAAVSFSKPLSFRLSKWRRLNQ